MHKQIVETQANVLRAMCPPIEAVGIGGSLGRGSPDRFSDVDFFLLYPSNRFLDFVIHFPTQISHPLVVLTHTGPIFVPGFGFEYTYIMQDGTAIDYNLNCRETLSLNPMRAHTRILYDTTGFLTRISTSARTDKMADRSVSACEALHDYLARLLKLRKSAYRRDKPVVIYHFDKLRLVMVAIDRALVLNASYNAFQADHRLGTEMGADYERIISVTYPTLDASSIGTAFQAMCARIRDGLGALDVHIGDRRDVWALERTLVSDTLSFIRGLT